MTIIFTNHAKIRQKQRGISSQQINQALKNPDIISEDKAGMPLIGKRINRHAIIVIFNKIKKGHIIVITVYKVNSSRLTKLKPVIEGRL